MGSYGVVVKIWWGRGVSVGTPRCVIGSRQFHRSDPHDITLAGGRESSTAHDMLHACFGVPSSWSCSCLPCPIQEQGLPLWVSPKVQELLRHCSRGCQQAPGSCVWGRCCCCRGHRYRFPRGVSICCCCCCGRQAPRGMAHVGSRFFDANFPGLLLKHMCIGVSQCRLGTCVDRHFGATISDLMWPVHTEK